MRVSGEGAKFGCRGVHDAARRRLEVFCRISWQNWVLSELKLGSWIGSLVVSNRGRGCGFDKTALGAERGLI